MAGAPSGDPSTWPRLTGTGRALVLAALLLFVAGAALGYVELTVLATAGLLIVAAAVVSLARRPRLDVRREIEPDRVPRGEVAVGQVTVKNLGRRVCPPMVAVDRLGQGSVGCALARLQPGSTRRTAYRLPTSRRGIVQVGPFALTRQDTLGLARVTRPVGDIRTLYVHPRVLPLARVPTGRTRSLDGPTSDSAPRGSITFHALREYVFGDDLRHIHWRSSARTGTLMVREHVDTAQTESTIVLDTRADRYDDDAFEEAVEVAASLAAASVRLRFPVRLVTTCGTAVGGRKPTHDAAVFLDHLTGVERREGGSMVEVADSLVRGRASDSLVIVTGTADADDLRVAASLKRRFGRVTVVSVRADVRRRATPHVPGVQVIDALTAGEFASLWSRSR